VAIGFPLPRGLLPKFSFHKHIDTLFLITHTSTFNISLQSLVLIQHLSSSLGSQPGSSSPSSRSQSIVDRYYRALYSSLHDERLASSSKQTMYLNLLFKSLKTDSNTERVKSFVRRFIQMLVSGGAGGTEFVVGGLYLLGEVSVTCIQPRWLMMTFTLPRFSALFRVCARSCKECQLPRKQKIMIPENETPSLHMHRLHRCTNSCVAFYGSPQLLTPSCSASTPPSLSPDYYTSCASALRVATHHLEPGPRAQHALPLSRPFCIQEPQKA
jgi:hypothetical protein